MKKIKTFNGTIGISELFRNLERQKEIAVSVRFDEKQLQATMVFNNKIGDEPLLYCSDSVHFLKTGDPIEVSFFFKDTFFTFDSHVNDVFLKSFSIKKPELVKAAFNRISSRYKIGTEESVCLKFQGKDESFRIIDISTTGLSFEVGTNNFYKGQILRNILLKLNEAISIYFDAEVKYIKQNGNIYISGMNFFNLDLESSQTLFHYIFKRSYPNCRVLSDFSEEDQSKIYEKAKYAAHKAYGNENKEFIDEIRNLEKVKNKPTIFIGIAHWRNSIITGILSALRIYNHTFIGLQPVLLPETYLNPKANANIFMGLSEHLLNHPSFKYFITYINSDYEWHQSIFKNIGLIINDREKLSFEQQMCYEFNIEDEVKKKESEYLTEILDNPSGFIQYCAKSLSLLENACFDYDNDGFVLNEIKGIYYTLNYSVARKLFVIKKGGDVIAYTVAECYTQEINFNNSLDTLRIYLLTDKIDLDGILTSIISEAKILFQINNKKKFRVYIQHPSNTTRDFAIAGLSPSLPTCRILMNREGLQEVVRLLMSNFEYYTKFYNLSQPQKSIWYTEKVFPGTCIGNIAGTLKIKGQIDYYILEKAINIFVEKNDAMRIRVVDENDKPKQYISNYSFFKVDFIDFSSCDINEYYKWDEKKLKTPFYLNDSVLYYFAIIKLSKDLYVLYAKTHHLISDAWSMNLLGSQILEYYKDLKNSKKISNAQKPSYMNYVLSEEEYKFSEKMNKSKEFWSKIFETIPEFMSFKSDNNMQYTRAKRKTFIMSENATRDIQSYCKKVGTSVFALFISVLSVYLSRKTGCEDLVIGTPILNRSGIKQKDTVGMFINSIPIRLLVNHNMEFDTYVNNIAKELSTYFKNQKYNYEMILNDFRNKHKITNRLYDVVVSYQNSKYEKKDNAEELEARWHFNCNQVESLVIHIDDREEDGKYLVNFDYLLDMFSEDEIESIFGYITNLIEDAIHNPEKELKNLNMLTYDEKEQLWDSIVRYNDTEASYPTDKVIHQLFEEQAERTPDNIALMFEDKFMTYKELDWKSNQIARNLREKGVKSGTIAAILMNHSFEMIIGILGILKAGGTYLPIDPSYPKDRIRYMLENSECDYVLTQDEFMDKIDFFCEKINLSNADLFAGNLGSLKNISKPEHLAYIIYTSGSTGKPKGAMITHQGLVNYITWAKKVYVRGDKISFPLYSSISFDLTVTSVFTPLLSGNKIVIYHSDNNELLIRRIFQEKKVDLVKLTPAHLQLIKDMDNKNSSIKRLILGGEDLKTELAGEIRDSFGGDIEIFNEYGPTETVVGCMIYKFNDEKDKRLSVPIGIPANNVQIYLLDRYLNPVPQGIPGEMYISGDGVGRGYLNRNKLTNEKFIANPFIQGKMMYKSGDMGVMLPDGNMEYLGRIDNQVKINGFRIELGEIESELLKYKEVKSAVVLDLTGTNGRKYLCAYVIKSDDLDIEELKRNLKSALPNYMVPTAFVTIDSIPLTANGKVDRRILEDMKPVERDSSSYVAPINEMEKELENTLCSMLKMDKVSMEDNLFELGMDSLMSMSVVSVLMSKGWELSIQDIYDNSTIKALSDKLQKQHSENSNNILELESIRTNIERIACQVRNKKEELGDVLLTGANGYLGVHVLFDMVTNTKAHIYCLVRGQDRNTAKNRLFDTLNFYFPDESTIFTENRITVLSGDITKEKFSLSDGEYTKLIDKVNIIFHLAALVKLFGNYKEFEDVNVEGTRRVVDFAVKYNKALRYASTISVSGNYLVRQKLNKPDFSENDFYIGQNIQDNVYCRSKFEAEKIILDKVDSGLNATIFRVGDLTNRLSDGTFQINASKKFTFQIMLSLIEIGIIPEKVLSEEFEFSPVDCASRAIMLLSQLNHDKVHIFHVFNHKRFRASLLLFEVLEPLGYKFEIVKNCSFNKYLEYIKGKSSKTEEISYLTNNFNYEHMFNDRYRVNLRSEYTAKCLERLGFNWPDMDKEYLKKVVMNLRSIGLLTK